MIMAQKRWEAVKCGVRISFFHLFASPMVDIFDRFDVTLRMIHPARRHVVIVINKCREI